MKNAKNRVTVAEKTIKNLKRKVIEIASKSGEDHHIASAFSIMDILWVLYEKILSIFPNKPQHPERDIFILSKGQASLGLYAILHEKGFFDTKTLESFSKYNSILGGHPMKNTKVGIESSTGSLGHGMPIAVGIALGLKIQNKKQKVSVLIGDGEANEGTVWESALLSSHHKLDNLCCIIDHNHSTDRALSIDSMKDKFESFGWKVSTVDGHNHKEIEKSLRTKHPKHPLAVIANTIKGHGVSMMKDNPAWHRKSPNKEEFELIMKELN